MWLVNRPGEYCAKLLYITPGWACSFHYHPLKTETFYPLAGLTYLEMDCAEIALNSGLPLPVTIPARTPHRFSSDGGAVLLEVSTFHSDDDVVRIIPSRRLPLND